jgi:hypothetical protein
VTNEVSPISFYNFGIALSSLTLCNTSTFLTWSAQLMFAILLQHHQNFQRVDTVLQCHVAFPPLRHLSRTVLFYGLLLPCVRYTKRNPGRGRFFCSPKRSDRLWGPPSLLTNGYRGSFPQVKRHGREVNHSLPSKAEVRNGWSNTSSSPIRLHGVDKENFTRNYIGDNWNTAVW